MKKILPILVFSILAIYFIFNSFNYGVTVDEHLYQKYGGFLFDYYASGFEDTSYKTYINLKYFGGFFNLTVGTIQKIALLFDINADYEIRHIVNALFGFLIVLGFYKFVNLFGHFYLSLIGVALIIFTPRVYGHFYNNSSDISFAAVFVWSIYYITKTQILRKIDIKNVSLLGFWIGAAIGTRYGGIILLLFLLVAFLISLIGTERNELLKAITTYFKENYKYILLFFGVAYFVAFASWPLMHENPLSAVKIAADYFSQRNVNEIELFRGSVIRYSEFPWYYTIYNLITTTPIYYLVLAAFSTIFTSLLIVSEPLKRMGYLSKSEIKISLFAIFWFLFPLFYLLISGAEIYNITRHIIFAIPGMIFLTLLGIHILRIMLKGFKPLFYVYIASLVIYLGAMIIEYVQLNPYQYVFYNSLIGSLKGASKGHKLDYWGHSIKELVEKTGKKLPKGKFYKFKVAFISLSQAENYYNEFMFSTSMPDYDCMFTVLDKSQKEHIGIHYPELKELVRVERKGVVLAKTLCKDKVFEEL